MNRLLLVEDDAVVLRSYRDRLSAHGFQVNTAASGSAALAILRSAKPDLVVLDLMMPEISGLDVLRFIRSQPRLDGTPVIVLTDSYPGELGRQAAAIGIQKVILKAQCSPSGLMACIDEVLRSKPVPVKPAQVSGVATTSARQTTPPLKACHAPDGIYATARPGHPPAAPAMATPAAVPHVRPVDNGESRTEENADLLAHARGICADLRKLFQATAQQAQNGQEQHIRLQDLYRRVHFLAATAGLVEYAQLNQTAAVFEGLLGVLLSDPALISPSVLRTLANLVDLVELLFRRAGEPARGGSFSGQVLVVDDDPLSNRLVASALRQAQLIPHTTEDALVALQLANQKQFDLILLDVEMPALNGFELCKCVRAMPGYKQTPIIFVSVHSDFESRAQSSLSGGNELIPKPILPMELAAKVVMRLVKGQMSGLAAAPPAGSVHRSPATNRPRYESINTPCGISA